MTQKIHLFVPLCVSMSFLGTCTLEKPLASKCSGYIIIISTALKDHIFTYESLKLVVNEHYISVILFVHQKKYWAPCHSIDVRT